MVKFRTTIELGGKTATGFEVPAGVVEQLGAGKKPKVKVTIGAHSYRSTVAVYGDRYMLPLAAENRTKAGVEAGDETEVALELDTEPRVVEVPEDFAQALAAEPAAQQTWNGLSYSNQRYHVLQIEGAKTEQTRQRRIAKSVDTLSQGKQR
ncbi:YdeI/OmpD-associated family protein [Actinomadura sp. KC06]|uniref:YdeI/OmpD-associated family protein n=1 Tax=Actinomadura sp. KC06 TaxID=2530369 RepID=UPI001A9D270E|nr:YdeI/OmpD-associated family protein [Actinomadura sp. KC06]